MSAGRLIPALAALAALAPAMAGAQDDAWVMRRLPWYSLPLRETVGTAPVSLETPPSPNECGAVSDRLDPFAARGPVLLRVAIRVESGSATVSVRDPAAGTVLSKTKTVTEGEGETVVYVRVEFGAAPEVIALCNPGQAGVGARVDIQSVMAARVGTLPADEAAKANLGAL